MTVRLGQETARELAELAQRYRSRSAAVQDAIHQAWTQLQDEKLAAGYAAVAAENPNYPYESAEEAAVLRVRRRDRAAHDDLA
jgi:Arc/MetJ-type ribon-helix-helix transcriptional regulator